MLHAQARTGWFARSRAAPPVQLRGRDREWPTAFPVVNSRVATPCTIPGPRERGCSEPRKCVAGLTDPRVCSVREGHHRGFLFWPDLLNSGYPGWRSALCMRSTSPWRSHDRVRSSGHHPCPRCRVETLLSFESGPHLSEPVDRRCEVQSERGAQTCGPVVGRESPVGPGIAVEGCLQSAGQKPVPPTRGHGRRWASSYPPSAVLRGAQPSALDRRRRRRHHRPHSPAARLVVPVIGCVNRCSAASRWVSFCVRTTCWR